MVMMMMVKDACEFRMKAALFLFSPNISLVFPTVINIKRDKQKGRLKSVFRKISRSRGEGGKRCSLQGKLPVTGISPTFKPFAHRLLLPSFTFPSTIPLYIRQKKTDWGREGEDESERNEKPAVSHPYSHFIHLNTCTSLLEAVFAAEFFKWICSQSILSYKTAYELVIRHLL